MNNIYITLQQKFGSSIRNTSDYSTTANIIVKSLDNKIPTSKVVDIIAFAQNCYKYLKISDIKMQLALYHIIFEMHKFYDVDDISVFVAPVQQKNSHEYFKMLNQFITNNKSLITLVYDKLFV